MDDWVIKGTTDVRGIATLKLAKQYGAYADVGAPGYLTRDGLSLGDGASTPGVGWFADGPLDIYLYKAPAPASGLRLPRGFRGPLRYGLGPDKGFPFPPDFPAGQRVWWSDFKPGGGTVVAQPPPLGYDPSGGAGRFRLADADGNPIPTPEPSAEVSGVAFWRIGQLEPDGPWGRVEPVSIVGDRAEAVAKAEEIWQRHGNGRTGYIYNGWLKVVSPGTKRGSTHANAVTRFGLAGP
jgi:hypothetical protein